MMKGIEFSKLTEIFQEAIFVTRRLGVKYLWIDSLCIMQDSTEDWGRESTLMTQVYSYGLFNISATAAEDGSWGLFYDRIVMDVRQARANVAIRGIAAFHVFVDENFRLAFKGPLTKRGWVIQERLMSPGNLHFTSNQLFRESREKLACETFPNGIP